MSVRLMSAVWDLDLPPSEKLVLLALADQANDEGRQCWPAVSTMAKRSGQTERTVRRALASLETKGHLTRKHRDGTSTQYHVHPCHNVTPDTMSPLTQTTKTPDTVSPKPSRTINTITLTRAKDWPELPEWMPAEPWNGFIAMRRKKFGLPTDRAVAIMIGKLERWRAQGHDPGLVLDNSTESEWKGLWEPKQNGKSRLQQRSGNGRKSAREIAEGLCTDISGSNGASSREFKQLPNAGPNSDDDGRGSPRMAYRVGQAAS